MCVYKCACVRDISQHIYALNICTSVHVYMYSLMFLHTQTLCVYVFTYFYAYFFAQMDVWCVYAYKIGFFILILNN